MSEENNPPNNLILLQLPKISSSFFAPKKIKEPIEDRETPPPHLLSAAVEAVLFVSSEPLRLERLNSILGI